MKYDVIIVGAGIAGLTAAIYARRAEKSVLVLEGKVPGGQIINTFQIENWPGDRGVSGVELMQKIQRQAMELGAEIEMEEVDEIVREKDGFRVVTEDDEYFVGVVILAVGAEDKKLGCKGESEYTGRGVSYCATCDGAFYKGKTVAVIGGGNTALYDALYLADIASKVYLVHRRGEFRGDAALVKKLKKRENVEFVLGYVPEEIAGDKKVGEVRLAASGLVETVAEGRSLNVDGVFVAVGKKPMTEKFAKLVQLNENGYIVAGEDRATSCPGVFAAGDCRTKTVRQLVTAAADGAVASTNALAFLSGRNLA
ncbi:thioredoxin-disulfide reductase [Candidatus Saccharibacteria bacterium]|nr:thioredoxin-disulfide reductase [Candidatus Saccharibacteria bacterium]